MKECMKCAHFNIFDRPEWEEPCKTCFTTSEKAHYIENEVNKLNDLCERCIHNNIPADCQPCYSCYSFPYHPCFEPIKTENKYKTEYVVITKEEYEDMLELIAMLKQELNKIKE